ncbi:glycosyltransferase [Telmatobacter sp. DSM 110680]|uniref:Glycosyltransferase n=1 Tax=Telmatobacter sp. DSM 110680 TaxID=3036704 RepID=A0AAU7DIJ7_9BACT
MRPSVLYITANWPFRSGSEVFFVPELKALRNAGIELRIVPRDVPRLQVMHDVPDGLVPCIHSEPLFSARVLWTALVETIRNPLRLSRTLGMLFSSLDLHLLLNLAVIPKALWLSRFSRRHGVTHLHAQWGGTTATMAMIASCMTDIPWSVTYHRNDIERANLLALKVRNASFVRFISEAGLAMAKKNTGLSHIDKARVIHLGIEIPPPQPIQERSRLTIPVICCAASLIPLKGHTVLLDALARVKLRNPDFQLLIAGDGELRGALETRCRELGLSESVRFLGNVSRTQLLSGYSKNEVDIFVLASYVEGIPVSAMEASAYGIPSIVSDVGGVKELLGNGAGILVPPGDTVALAEALECLMIDPEVRHKFGSSARERVEQDFNARRTVGRFLELVMKHSLESRQRERSVGPQSENATVSVTSKG